MIKIKNIGLAAYIKLKGCPLIQYRNDRFYFETNLSSIEWKLQYSNSICLKREQALHDLRSYFGTDSFLQKTENPIWTSSLDLAAYVSAQGTPIVGFDKGKKRFYFESNRDFNQIQIEYTNSECTLHAAEVNRLREIVKVNR